MTAAPVPPQHTMSECLDANTLLCAVHGIPQRKRHLMRAAVDAAMATDEAVRAFCHEAGRSGKRAPRLNTKAMQDYDQLLAAALTLTEAVAPHEALRATAAERRAEVERRAPLVHRRMFGLRVDAALAARREEALAALLARGLKTVDAATVADIFEAARTLHHGHAAAQPPLVADGHAAAPAADPLEDGLASSDED